MRYTHLNAQTRPLTQGLNPPAGRINPDYKQLPGNSRRCISCSRWHDTIVENTMTGERLTELDKCKDCTIQGWFK